MENTQALYLELAQQACALERASQWLQASEFWRQAMISTTKTVNRDWAETRAQYCAARARCRFQITYG